MAEAGPENNPYARTPEQQLARDALKAGIPPNWKNQCCPKHPDIPQVLTITNELYCYLCMTSRPAVV